MKTDKIKTLLAKYYEGNTSLEEEIELKNALKSMDQLPEELSADTELFTMMDALASESIDNEIDFETQESREVQIAPNLPADEAGSREFNFSWITRIAAGFSLLIVGAFAGWILGRQGAESTDVAGLRSDINEMKQLVTLSQLRKESASERIMATYEFKKLDSASDEILDALIYAFNNDNNINVKNAAADALYKFGNHDKVRKAFINGLNASPDPILQIKLIDMLVGLDEKRALPKLQEMMQAEVQIQAVKQKAAQGIGKLL